MTSPTTPGPAPGVDLDDEPAPPPSAVRPWHPYRAAMLGCALAGLAAGAAVSGVTHPAPPTTGALLATVEVRGVVLGEQPAAVLTLGLSNVGDGPLVATEVTLSGAGLERTTRPLGRTMWPGVPDAVTVRVALGCSRADAPAAPLDVVVQVRPGPGAGVRGSAQAPPAVTAVPTGRAASTGGLCSAADAALPDGWQERARATGWSFGPDDALRLQVSGLAADVTDVSSAQADGVIVPLPNGPVPVHDGSVTLPFGAPGTGCQATGTRPVVPTGLELVVHSGRGARRVYVPVGLPVADWLMRTFVRACPDSPEGPSGIRPLLTG